MPSELYTLLFEGFLKLQECGGSQSWGCFNNEFQHDFVFALFLPHVVLIAFFYMAFRGLGNKGIEALLAVGGYMFLITMGWYPMYATLTIIWMAGAILLSFYFFVMAQWIHPAKTGAYAQAAKGVANKLKALHRRGLTETEIMEELKRDVLEIDNPALRLALLKDMKNLCPSCGAANPPGRAMCMKCNAPLRR